MQICIKFMYQSQIGEHPRAYYCGQQYKNGCFCQKGFVRNKDNKCVKLEECPNLPHHHEL